MPIVDGTRDEFENEIEYLYLNAKDGGVGEETFAYYGLRGHPTLLYVDANGRVVWQRVGVISRDELETLLENPVSDQ